MNYQKRKEMTRQTAAAAIAALLVPVDGAVAPSESAISLIGYVASHCDGFGSYSIDELRELTDDAKSRDLITAAGYQKVAEYIAHIYN